MVGGLNPEASAHVRLRPMTEADIELGMRLKAAAGWNQTRADWEMLLEAGQGLVAIHKEIEVGTATVIPYEDAFGWIGMVLVDPDFRRRGIGTALLRAALALTEPQGCARLDATPQGQHLYVRLGFSAEHRLVRMRRRGDAARPPASPGGRDLLCEPITPERLPDVVRFDSPIFGAKRGFVLTSLWQRAPCYGYLAWRDGQVAGYCLGRAGSQCEQIGPIVARDLPLARALLTAALRYTDDRDVIVDAMDEQSEWMRYLAGLGFLEQRPFIRMYRGPMRPSGQTGYQFAIAGPEIG